MTICTAAGIFLPAVLMKRPQCFIWDANY